MMRKCWVGALPLVMVAGSLVAVPQVASSAQAAPAPVTTLSPSSPIKMERFNYWSGVSTQFIRPVVLQKKVGNSWRTIFSGKTAANGKYRFTVHTGSVDTLRSYTAATKHKGKTYPALATTPITVRPVNQSIGLSMASTSAATVTTSPGRNGRLVTVQRYSGGKWVHVSHARTNATGKYSFTLNAPAGSFRALAEGFNGAASMTSASKSVKKLLPDGFSRHWELHGETLTIRENGTAKSVARTYDLNGCGGKECLAVKEFSVTSLSDKSIKLVVKNTYRAPLAGYDDESDMIVGTTRYSSRSYANPGDYYILTVQPDGNALTTLYSSGGKKKLEGKPNGIGTPWICNPQTHDPAKCGA